MKGFVPMGESAFKVYLLVVILVIDDGSKFVWMRSWGSVDDLVASLV